MRFSELYGGFMKAVRFHDNGGPEVLKWEEVEDPAAAPGEVLIRLEAVGLNYIDTYHREGLYPVPLPSIPGVEGAGEVVAPGDNVDDIALGDKVATPVQWARTPSWLQCQQSAWSHCQKVYRVKSVLRR